MTQLSNVGRVVRVVGVAQGDVYVADAGDTTWTPATNNSGATPPLNFDGLLYSTCLNQLMFFVDGVNYVYYKPPTNEVLPWVATNPGVLPADADNNYARLTCTWRGRLVLSGLLLDPQNWFMSRVFDPFDWDYGPTSVSPDQPIAGNNAPAGLIGDVVTSMCPYTDDVLVMFGDHSIYMFNGDPMAGGQIDLITNAIGGAFGICWCIDPVGTIYFLSNRTGIYTLVPGQKPQRISQQIEQLLNDLDTGSNGFRLFWDDRFQGLHVFCSPLAAPGTATHFFYEARSGAWWTDQFGNSNHDPLTGCVFDGNTAGDRRVLLGSWDGYVRFLDPSAVDDDGTAITSSVVIGPILTDNLDAVMMKDIQAVLGNASGAVTVQVYTGATAELALVSTPIFTGTWTADRNLNDHVRGNGHAIYVKLSSTVPWSMEQIRMRLTTLGKVQMRGR